MSIVQNILGGPFNRLSPVLALLFGCVVSLDCGARSNPQGGSNSVGAGQWGARADSAQAALQKYFWDSSGSIFYMNTDSQTGDNYWWQAHAMDVLVDGYLRTKDPVYVNRIAKLYSGLIDRYPGLTRGYYDDMEWMALALLRAYDATGSQAYLNASNSLWRTIEGGWSSTPGQGGIRWQTGEPIYKNVPANAPACMLACRLFEQSGDSTDLSWSKKIMSWMQSHLVDSLTGSVMDGITYQGGSAEDNRAQYTYNYGTYIGASLDLSKVTGDKSYLSDALRTADFADSTLTVNGILKDEGTGDGGLFKGIYVRYLVQLVLDPALPISIRNRYEDLLQRNATSLWYLAREPGTGLFNHNWQAPPSGSVDLSVELSGIMLLEGEALVNGSD